jgi:PAS domain S-box-containing protein
MTDTKREHEALREAHDANAAILSASLDGYWVIDSDGRLLDVNSAYIWQSGYARDEVVGKHISGFEIKLGTHEIAAEIQKIIKIGNDQFCQFC